MSRIILALYILTSTAGLILFKLGSNSGLPISYIDSKINFNLNLYNMGGVLLYGFSFIMYMYLISKFDLGYIIPLAAGCVYILIFIAVKLSLKIKNEAIKISM